MKMAPTHVKCMEAIRSPLPDSNGPPAVYKAAALPDELRRHSATEIAYLRF